MRATKRKGSGIPLLAAAMILTGAASGCGGGGSAGGGGEVQTDANGFAATTGTPQKGGTVTVLGNVDLASLDPAVGNDGNVNNFYRLIYRTLTTYANEPGDGGTKVVPDLATTTGEPSDNAKVWTFTLRDDIYFADGSPITSEDVKFGFERSLDPTLSIGNQYGKLFVDGAAKYKGVFSDPDGLKSIETPDDKTVVFHLNRPLAAFPNVVSTGPFVPFPADAVKTPQQIGQKPIASGPYQIKSYARGTSLALERNPKWTAEGDPVRKAYPDGYNFLFNVDQNTIDQRMISDEGDDKNAMASSTNPLLAPSLSRIQTPELKQRTVHDIPACTMYMAMNTTKKPLDDLTVRQAINYAIDKKSVVTATGGPMMATPATDMLTPKVPGRVDFDLYPSKDKAGDVAKAKKLLADAGHPDGFSVTMDVRSIPKWQAQAEAAQASLKKVGIDVKLNVIDASTFYDVLGQPAKQNDLAITGWCSAWLSGQPLLTTLFDGRTITSKGNQDISQFDDPTINKRIDEIAQISDLDKQDAEYAKLNREIMEKAPVVPLVRETPLQMVGSNVGGAFAHAAQTGYIDYTSVGLKDPQG
ncbi:ABC transporter substrate-binding protein [Microlunatus soli]|uniref:Peptide/nickel transport system substrate-binding protein n=1 Tax=Microlunatus soli TaxID=630515 RepID=A0A1H1SHW3_9ACTN|nr:ABC transporter substrate-binding protein [Microlunatus soli]SDS47604.1 peptide/nickel transport system substrate-binding protein [Microlunatus soli]